MDTSWEELSKQNDWQSSFHFQISRDESEYCQCICIDRYKV